MDIRTKLVFALVAVSLGSMFALGSFSYLEARELLREMAALPGLRIGGLMTMEPYAEDPEAARPYFRRMRRLWEELREEGGETVDLAVLSMGMTNSYRVAVEEGANMVRIGTAIFGPRSG